LIVLVGLSAAAHAEDEQHSSPDPACPRSEVLAHVQAQFRLYGPLSERREYFGFIYRSNGEVESSVAMGRVCGNNHVCGIKIAPAAKGIPAGAKVLGEWHTHPLVDGSRNLSVQDVRGAFHNRHIRCYTAFYSAPNGDIYRWDVSQTSVLPVSSKCSSTRISRLSAAGTRSSMPMNTSVSVSASGWASITSRPGSGRSA